jgi:hypothetical protein
MNGLTEGVVVPIVPIVRYFGIVGVCSLEVAQTAIQYSINNSNAIYTNIINLVISVNEEKKQACVCTLNIYPLRTKVSEPKSFCPLFSKFVPKRSVHKRVYGRRS